MDTEHIEKLKQIVELGGANWVGIQEAFPEDKVPAYVLFTAPVSDKLLMLPDDEFFTTGAVHEKVYLVDKRHTFEYYQNETGDESD